MAPSARTLMVGVNACTVVSAFTCTGADQVTPPSEDCVMAMPSCRPPEKRESCQATYTTPPGETLTDTRSAPSRTTAPLRGSVVPTACRLETTTGGIDQVVPLSSDWVTRTDAVTAPPLAVSSSVNTSSRLPFGSTTTWLPRV